jgi:two-component system NarL family sensor kinase
MAIFRVVQEALANVQQHSGSAAATVRISRSANHIWIQVNDPGNGIASQPALAPSAVGINGMRERLRQMGGTLIVHPNGLGALVTAELPIG